MVLAAVCLVAPGCMQKGTDAGKEREKVQAKEKPQAKEKKDEKGHEHGEVGPHGGPLADWDDTYHAEFTVVPAEKKVIVFILDNKAEKAPTIAVDKITEIKLNLKAPTKVEDLELKHDAKLSGEKGIAYTGTHDAFAKEGDFEGVIRGKVDGKEYRDGFKTKKK
jgi:hypothetical protein